MFCFDWFFVFVSSIQLVYPSLGITLPSSSFSLSNENDFICFQESTDKSRLEVFIKNTQSSKCSGKKWFQVSFYFLIVAPLSHTDFKWNINTVCVCVCVLCNGPALSCDVRRMTNRAGFSSESLGSSFLFPTLSSFKTSIKHLQQLLLLLQMPNNKYQSIHLWLIQTGEGGRLYESLITTGKIVIRSHFYCEGQRRLSSKPPTNKKIIKMIINGDNWIKLSK